MVTKTVPSWGDDFVFFIFIYVIFFSVAGFFFPADLYIWAGCVSFGWGGGWEELTSVSAHGPAVPVPSLLSSHPQGEQRATHQGEVEGRRCGVEGPRGL